MITSEIDKEHFMANTYTFKIDEIEWSASRLAREYIRPQNYDAQKHMGFLPRPDYYTHKHSDFELHYIFRGNCSFSVGTRNFFVQQGEYILISPNTYHCIKQVSDDISKMCVSLSFTHSSKTKLSKDSETLVSCFMEFDAFVSNAKDHAWLFSSICKQPKEELVSFYEVEEMKAYLALLVLQLSQQLKEQKNLAPQNIRITSKQDADIIEFFNLNFRLSNGADILSEQLHVSRRHLDRILKKQYGKNYREMLQEARLARGLDLLTSTNKTIAEIANLIGYSNPASFITFIKNQTGTTPLQLRKISKQAT